MISTAVEHIIGPLEWRYYSTETLGSLDGSYKYTLQNVNGSYDIGQ